MKYLVMETHTSYAVVLDEAGDFHTAANFGYAVGQSLEQAELLDVSPAAAQAAPRRYARAIAMVAAVAACMVLFLYSVLSPQVYASVYMTINPRLRIDLNKSGGVVRVVGLNEDGKRIVREMDLKKGESVEVAAADITKQAIDDEYLKDEGKVELIVETDDAEFYSDVGQTLKDSVETTIKVEGVSAKVDMDIKIPEPAASPSPTPTPTTLPTPVETEATNAASATPTPAPVQEDTPAMVDLLPMNSPAVPTVRPTPVYTPTPSPTPKVVGSPTPSTTAVPTPTPTPVPTSTETGKPVETVLPTPTPTPVPSIIPSDDPTPTSGEKDEPSPTVSIGIETPTQTPKPVETLKPTTDPVPSGFWDDSSTLRDAIKRMMDSA